MGENVKSHEKHPSTEAFREQIRRTESDITDTLQALEQRLSPRNLRQRGVRKAKSAAWRGTAKLLDLAQHTSVQASMVAAGAGTMWLLMRNRNARVGRIERVARKRAGAAAKAIGASALWMWIRKNINKEPPARKPAVSRVALAATVAKAFLGGARATKKSGTTRPGRKVAWRGVATALGSALGSYWYSRRHRRA